MLKFRNFFITLSLLTLLFIALIVVWGYEYGTGDHVQIFPTLLANANDTLFSKDIYIQNTIHNFPNERSFLLLVLQLFYDEKGYGVFIFHYIISILLLWALLSIAGIFLKNKVFAWAALLILLFPLYLHNLGLCELYNNGLHPGEAIAAWAIFFWIKRKLLITYLLLITASLLHPIVGIQVFVVITGAQIIISILESEFVISLKKLLPYVFLYFVTAGIFIISVQNRFDNANMGDDELFKLFFVFRNSHHYLPENFPFIDWLILTPFFIITPFIFSKIDKRVSVFSALIIFGCIFYALWVDIFHSVTIASSQWFKVTTWLEFFAIISGMIILQKIFPKLVSKKYAVSFFTLTLAVCIIWVFFLLPGMYVIKNSTKYELPFYTKITDEIDISLQANQLTPVDALFTHPCNFSALKFYGQRSSYIDFKAITHKESYLIEWAKRFEDIYQLGVNDSITGLQACTYGDTCYKNLESSFFDEIKQKEGITHVIMYKECNLPYVLLAENNTYKLYEL